MEMHTFKKCIKKNNYKMFGISVKKYTKNKVHTITMGNRKLFWVRMRDVKEGLGIQNISDLVRKEINIFEINNPTNDQIRNYKRAGKEWFSEDVYTYVRKDLILKIIKNCRGVKKTGDGKKRRNRKKKGKF